MITVGQSFPPDSISSISVKIYAGHPVDLVDVVGIVRPCIRAIPTLYQTFDIVQKPVGRSTGAVDPIYEA